MMKNPEASDAAREYAEDEQQFHSTFVTAFEKVLNRDPNENEL